MSYIGKFVCYDQLDGGACWGRIKEELIVNTIHGEKEAFILEHRYVRTWRTQDLRNYRQSFPDAVAGRMVTPKSMSHPMTLSQDDKPYLETRKVRGDTLLRKEMIDLENDIIDLDDVLGEVENDLLFKAVLNAKDGEVNGKSALEIGIHALLKNPSLSDEAIKALKKRLQ